MKNFLLALVAAALIGAFGAGTMLSQDTGPLPTKLGFVDVGRVFEESNRRKAMEERINKQTDEIAKGFEDRRDKLNEARDALDLLNPDSEDYRKQQRALSIEAFLLERDSKEATQRLKDEMRRAKGLLYREINLEIAAYGEQNGFAGIWLSVPVTDELDERGDIDLVTSTRSVLWHSERLDVTDAVIKLLNKS